MTLTAEQLLQSIWAALRRIEDNMALPPAPLELPTINVPPPDLTDIVTAVQGLSGTSGPTADDIARALADVLSPRTDDSAGDALRQVAEGLKTLDHRLQGFGKQAYGGGAATIDKASVAAAGLAKETTLESLRADIADGVSVTDQHSQPLTDTQLRATAVPVSDATLTGRLPDLVGVWSYYAGAAGTVNVAAGGRVIGIAAHAVLASTLTINGGASIPIPAGTSIAVSPQGNLVAPTLVFGSTASYVVEVLT